MNEPDFSMPKTTRHATFKVYQDSNGKWRWNLTRSSDIIADSGQGYSDRTNCELALSNVLNIIQAKNYEIHNETTSA